MNCLWLRDLDAQLFYFFHQRFERDRAMGNLVFFRLGHFGKRARFTMRNEHGIIAESIFSGRNIRNRATQTALGRDEYTFDHQREVADEFRMPARMVGKRLEELARVRLVPGKGLWDFRATGHSGGG